MENFEFGQEPEDIEIPPELTDAIGKIIEGLVPPGADIEVVPEITNSSGLLKMAILNNPADEVMAAVVANAGAVALRHALECDKHGDDPEAGFDLVMDALASMLEHAKEHLRPLYLETVEEKQFERAVESDLEELEVIGDAELAKLIESYSHEEEE